MAVQIVSSLHTQINNAIGTTLANKAGDIVNIISPVVMSAFLLYVLFVAMSYIKNGSDPTEMGMDFLQRLVGWSVIIGLSMNIGNFTSIVVPIVNGVPVELMNVFVPNGGDPYAQLDTLVETYQTTIQTGWDNAHGIEATMMAVVICLILLVAGIVAVVITTAYLLLAELFVAIMLSLAPIFIVLALFPQTRNYTSLWVAQVVNFGITLVLTSILTGLQIMILTGFVVPSTSEMNWSFALQVALVSGVFVVLIYQIPSVSSALSGGMTLNGYTQAGRSVMGGAKSAGAVAGGAGRGAMGGAGAMGRGGMGAYNYFKGKFGGNKIKAETAGK